jgi:hypothetical protein
LADENKGHVKVTLDVEINGALMDMMKECVENTPQLVQAMSEHRKKKEQT